MSRLFADTSRAVENEIIDRLRRTAPRRKMDIEYLRHNADGLGIIELLEKALLEGDLK